MELAWSCLLAACARLIRLPALLCCEAMAWALTFIAFPLRMLTAVDRERKLGRLVAEMQVQMDDLAWENTALEDRMQAAIREQETLEAVLDEMEDEHEDALARIHVLETQLKALRQENMRLNEHKGKSKWDKSAAARHGNGGSRVFEPDKKPAKRGREEEDPAAAAAREEEDAAKRADPASALALTTTVAAADESEALATALAWRRSLFSLGMSLAVGAAAWSADAPCLPLLAGLFAVVGVSMRSASRLRRAGTGTGTGDAVVLLGLNWFLLGMLTSPMLPGVVRAIVPRAGQALGPALTGIAATVPL